MRETDTDLTNCALIDHGPEADAHKYLDVIESDIRARIRHMPVRPEYLAALAAGRVRP